MPARRRRNRRGRRRRRSPASRGRGLLRRQTREAVRRLLLQGLLLTALCTVTINGLVRALGGGDPHLLSPRHLGDKAEALGALCLHGIGHVFGGGHPDARTVLRAAARQHGIPEHLAIAVARAESGFDPHAISRTGAMGLMQLMPSTAAEMGVTDPFDSAENARGGARYLGVLLTRYGGALPHAVAAYNAGPGRVRRGSNAGPGLPPETRAYVRAVLGGDGPWAVH